MRRTMRKPLSREEQPDAVFPDCNPDRTFRILFRFGDQLCVPERDAHEKRRRKRRACRKAAYSIYQAYDSALVTILIGNNFVNIASSSVATVIALSLMGDEGALVATAVMTVLILTFGEIVPKIVAVQVAEGFAKVVALPLRAMMIVTKPIVWVFNKLLMLLDRLWAGLSESGPSVTEDDLETILETVEDEGVIDEDRAELLQSALDFGDVLAYEVITPRVDMLAIDIEDPWDEVLETAYDSPFPAFRSMRTASTTSSASCT